MNNLLKTASIKLNKFSNSLRSTKMPTSLNSNTPSRKHYWNLLSWKEIYHPTNLWALSIKFWNNNLQWLINRAFKLNKIKICYSILKYPKWQFLLTCPRFKINSLYLEIITTSKIIQWPAKIHFLIINSSIWPFKIKIKCFKCHYNVYPMSKTKDRSKEGCSIKRK